MSKHLRILIVAAVLVGVLAMSAGSVAQARQKVTITWFVGLGTGSNPEQQAAQEQVVADFNKSQDKIELVLNITLNQVAQDTLSTLIAGGTPPDIVGPVGFQGANLFGEEWLDLQPLVEKTGYQLEQYPSSLIDSYRELATGALTGLPFAVYPGVLYYNKDLFDEAGLSYPPAVAGDPYVMPDGTEVPWDYDTVANIGKILTVDANGNDATSPDFDPNNIVQYGFIHQWDTIRSDFSTFGAAPVVNADGKVQFPDAWRAEAHWLWDSIWTWHISPTDSVISSTLMNSNAFASGKVAMARSMGWYTCCLSSLTSAWDLAVQPAYKGTIYAPIDLDTFRIDKNTPHPEEAFQVLTYFLSDAELALTTVYGAYPALSSLQPDWTKAKAEQYPSVTHWEVIPDSIPLAPLPHHESWYPGYNKGQVDVFGNFRTLLYTDGTINVDTAFDQLQADIQAVVDEASK